jgi:hypothetical protein
LKEKKNITLPTASMWNDMDLSSANGDCQWL